MAGSLAGRNVLVVGGAGYVGNVLVRMLLGDGAKVRVLDRLLFDHGSALAGTLEEPDFDFVKADLADDDAVRGALDGIDDVVILAALVGDPIASKYPDLARRVNDQCKNVALAADEAGVKRLVFTSTCSNYGLRDTNEPADETSDLAPVSLYAEMKVDFETFVLDRADEWSLCPTLLRIATAYGLSQRMRFDLTISEFTRTLAVGDELVVYDADTWRPYCHVRDISAAIMTVLKSEPDLVRNEVFNVGHSDENYTKRMVADAALEALDGEGKVSYEEGGRDPRNYRVSFEKIKDVLGFEPRHRVPETIRELVSAVQAGIFDDFDRRPDFYTNHSVVIPGESPAGDD
ncbi:MAG TPA: NAD(P)-dependent oxidoreductase [Solirubrobacterales bacterium]|nr:NAD(P)-dependent oxidoreductase [Solirubrobacterales bacterium]